LRCDVVLFVWCSVVVDGVLGFERLTLGVILCITIIIYYILYYYYYTLLLYIIYYTLLFFCSLLLFILFLISSSRILIHSILVGTYIYLFIFFLPNPLLTPHVLSEWMVEVYRFDEYRVGVFTWCEYRVGFDIRCVLYIIYYYTYTIIIHILLYYYYIILYYTIILFIISYTILFLPISPSSSPLLPLQSSSIPNHLSIFSSLLLL
jgi:hypothetical protein